MKNEYSVKPILALTWIQAKNYLISGCNDNILIWQVYSQPRITIFRIFGNSYYEFIRVYTDQYERRSLRCLSMNEDFVITSNNTDSITLWKINLGLIRYIKIGEGDLNCVIYDNNSKKLIISGQNQIHIIAINYSS